MVAFDANLPIYAYDADSPHQRTAGAWFDATLASGVEIGIPFPSILAFIRISTHPTLLRRPASVADALAVVDSWLARPNTRILSPGPNHWAIFRNLYTESKATGKVSTDIHIAALAIEHSATLYTAERDFARFPGLRWINPLTDHV